MADVNATTGGMPGREAAPSLRERAGFPVVVGAHRGAGSEGGEGGGIGTLEHAEVGASFEGVYREAAGEMSRVRWADGRPNPLLVSWLNAEAPGLVRPGCRTVVVGCGLGDDVVELTDRGYDVTGFDIAPTAVEWARRRFPAHASDFVTADLLDLPSRLRRRFDLVVEIYTLQSLDPALREDAARAVAGLSCPRGTVLTIARARDESEPLEDAVGPPWPLTTHELTALMDGAGLRPLKPVERRPDSETPPVMRLRGVFVHA